MPTVHDVVSSGDDDDDDDDSDYSDSDARRPVTAGTTSSASGPSGSGGTTARPSTAGTAMVAADPDRTLEDDEMRDAAHKADSVLKEEMLSLKDKRRNRRELIRAEAVKETKKRWAYEIMVAMRKGAGVFAGARCSVNGEGCVAAWLLP